MRCLATLLLSPLLVAACATGTKTTESTQFAQQSNPRSLTATVTGAEMDELLALWRKFEMPEPPPDAPLVLLTHNGTSWHNGVKQPPVRSLGFLAKPDSALVFNGIETADVAMFVRSVEPIVGKDVVLSSLQNRFYQYTRVFDFSVSMAIGIQCHDRGYTSLGRALVAEGASENFESVREVVPQPKGGSPRNALGTVIWGYWFDQAMQPDTDRKVIVERLRAALLSFSSLQSEDARPRNNYALWLEQLAAATEPSTAPPGSVRALVDSLVDVHLNLSDWRLNWFRPYALQTPVPEPLRALLQKGFDAVPELLASLNDLRLTRSTLHPRINGAERPVSVGELVRCVLQSIADRDISQGWSISPATGEYQSNETLAMDWWAAVRELDEGYYQLHLALGQPAKFHFQVADPDAAIIVIGHKYPWLLELGYTGALEAGTDAAPWLEAIARSNLEARVKSDLFLLGARSKKPTDRTDSLRALSKVDSARFDEMVLARLKALDGVLDRNAPLKSDAIQYTLLAQLSDSSEVWAALLDLARRAEPALRVRILGRFGSSDDVALDPNRRLSFLASFLDDNSVRQRNDDVTECDPVLAWRTISVRHFAASRIGELLKLEPAPDSSWNKAQWAALHTRVSEALNRLGIQPMAQPN